MNLGLAIKQVRQHLSVSQMELSQKTGISQTSISQIESGAKNPSKRSIAIICKKLGIPEAVLYVMGMESTDVPASRLEIYDKLYPAIKEMAVRLMPKSKSDLLN